ncbi:MAG: hypothetical protein SWX82_10190 [Cyanobacteriota bacterium]|nr:hypothetical protein [Cyanobacteriota bacterium]
MNNTNATGFDITSALFHNNYYWTIVIALVMSAIRSKCGSLIALFHNNYYWTIVIALLMSAIRSKCGSLIALRLQ